jgi:YHS domain-containing protein
MHLVSSRCAGLGRPSMKTARTGNDEAVELDPVCGCPVLLEDAASAEHDGHTFHFCSDGCRDRFLALSERVHLEERLRSGALFRPWGQVRWGHA